MAVKFTAKLNPRNQVGGASFSSRVVFPFLAGYVPQKAKASPPAVPAPLPAPPPVPPMKAQPLVIDEGTMEKLALIPRVAAKIEVKYSDAEHHNKLASKITAEV